MPIALAIPDTVSGSVSTAPSTCQRGSGAPGGPSQLLGERQELAVQAEDGERGPAEELLVGLHDSPPTSAWYPAGSRSPYSWYHASSVAGS